MVEGANGRKNAHSASAAENQIPILHATERHRPADPDYDQEYRRSERPYLIVRKGGNDVRSIDGDDPAQG